MSKIKNPVRFSTYFKIDHAQLIELGVLNATLNVDTKLFIDPFLIPDSKHPEIAKGARATYEKPFRTVIRLLAGLKKINDAPWKGARRLLMFPEIKYTCLGYGSDSIWGSGEGSFTIDGIIQTAKEIVDLGISDPDLFVAMGLFEAGIGPDMISDMATNVILPDLLTFNTRILEELKIPTTKVAVRLKNGNS